MTKTQRIPLAPTLLVLPLLAASCGDTDASDAPIEAPTSVQAEIDEAAEALRTFPYERRAELSELLAHVIEKRERAIEELRAETPEGGDEAPADWLDTLDELEEERRLLMGRAERLPTATEEGWEQLRDELADAYDRFEERLALAANER